MESFQADVCTYLLIFEPDEETALSKSGKLFVDFDMYLFQFELLER